jgi:hypothetical protein
MSTGASWYRFAVTMDGGERCVGWAKIYGPTYSGTPAILLGEARAISRQPEGKIATLHYLEPVN